MPRIVLEKSKLFWLSQGKAKTVIAAEKNKLIVKAREGKISGIVSRNVFAGSRW